MKRQTALGNRALARWAARILLALALTVGSPALSAQDPQGASRVNQLLQKLKAPSNGHGVEFLELSEGDLNDFSRVVLRSRKELGVQALTLDLQPGGLIAGRAVVDMDRVQVGSFATSMFRTLLSGTQTLDVRGKLTVKNRRAVYDIQEAAFNQTYVPAWLVSSVLAYLASKQPPHVDITEPFELPFGISDLRVEADKLVIVR